VWAVAILTLLWNGGGAYTIVMAQMGSSLDMDAREIAYYANQPFWFVLTTDIALLSAVAAAIVLLLRSRVAAWLFALSLFAIVANNLYDVAANTSLALADSGWRNLTIVIVVVAILQFAYAWTMTRRAVLS
jgi:hypothetical protein